MLSILKASAGSGKTYNLAKEYIRLIVGSAEPDAYRHVLAVTFTNKATGEMKRRILEELHILSTAPEKSRYTEDLIASGAVKGKEELQKRAAHQLSRILHDYSAFAVSTIDRFFQQTLRAFAREIGQFASYQVQVDREALLSESVDRVLDSLGEDDKPLLEWLTGSARENLQEKGKIGLEDDLMKMAKELSGIPEELSSYDKASMEKLRSRCEEIIKSFPERVIAATSNVLEALSSVGVEPEDTAGKFLAAIRKNLDGPTAPTEAFVRKAGDPEQWFKKADAGLLPVVRPALEGPMNAFLALWGLPYREYVTALILKKQIYSLGVAKELRDALDAIQKEKNILSLDDSAGILRDIIDNTPTPFIYEKMGVRYGNFLLDEFQDTSDIQWDNFRPLLHSGIDSGNESLVVGDVKQSIYRWRGSDWELLGSRLEKEFRETRTTVLDGNWRTCREIVNFNDAFFSFAAKSLDTLLGTDTISRLYEDVRQKACFKDSAPGSVEAVFTEDEMAEVLSTIAEVRSRGGEYSDIAILVRGNGEGSAIAAELIANGIPVVSDDSLFVKSSVTVRRLVSQLSLVESAPVKGAPGVAGYLARSLDVEIPSAYHSLTDLAESILRDIRKADEDTFEAEVPYIQSFMDYLQEWTESGGNNLAAFLSAWEEASPKISPPASGNSVRVMTIHKSKGLEFPFVIVPFAEKVTLYKAPTVWARPKVEGTALEGAAEGVYPVTLDTRATASLFSDAVREEALLQAADAINVFYVALTRAKYGLKIIASPPPGTIVSAIKKGLEPGWKNLSQILYAHVGGESFKCGEYYDFRSLKREKSPEEEITIGYPSFGDENSARLRFSPEAAGFFGEDGLYGPEASTRIRGNVLHGILSEVKTKEDLPAAVRFAADSGDLPPGMVRKTLEFLGERIDSVADRGWFSGEGKLRLEVPVLSPEGKEYRPDRVVIRDDASVDIIDYKFGKEEEGYKWQVKRYVNLYRKMGYKKVEGYLWYLEDNLLTFVN